MQDKLLKQSDFIWHEKYQNNIKSNPLDYWYTAYYNGDASRKYYIVPQYPLIDNRYTDMSQEPELYIYFEANGRKLGEHEKDCPYTTINDGFVYNKGTFKRAYKTIEEAKDRAYQDYIAIYGYAMSFIEPR